MTQTTGKGPERTGPSASPRSLAETAASRSALAARLSAVFRADSNPDSEPGHGEGLAHGPRQEATPSPRQRRYLRALDLLARPGIAETLAAVFSALVFAWRVARPSPWWDEAITRDVTSRSASEIIDLTGHVDLVHAAYYLSVHALLGSSPSITPIRLISVVAAALTSAVLVRLGRELGSGRVGLAAAGFWTAAPLVSRYAQEARPYALVALAATIATLALVRVCRRPWLPGRWALYLLTLLLLGLLNVLALLLLVVHLSYLLATSSATVRRRWYLAAGGALVLLSPLLIASGRQSEQVAWLPRPSLHQLTGFLLAEYSSGLIVLVLVLVAVARLGRGTHNPALGLGLSWALLPPVILWTVSQAHPLFDWRYVFFTLPGTALALGSLATLLRRRWVIAAVLVLAVGGMHMQLVYRYIASGHGENLRGAAQAIADRAQPGDAVLFLPASRRVVEEGFPEAFKRVDDVALARSGEQSATIWGVEEPVSDLAASLHHRYRVWLVTGPERYGEQEGNNTDREKERLLYDNYRLAGVSFVNQYEIRLYERTPMPSVAGATPSS